MFQFDKNILHILNEKKGVTSNSTKTVDYIRFLVLECIKASNPHASRPINLSLNYQPFVEAVNARYDEKKDCIVFDYEFSFPKTATMSWMSSVSKLYITCKRYSSEKTMLKDSAYRGSIQSYALPDKTNNKTIIQLKIDVCFAPYPSKNFYVGGYVFTDNDYTELTAAIQHEINHLNKRDTFIETEDYKKNYTKLLNILTTNRNTDKNIRYSIICIAELIYRYCVKTEREAFTEQFYKEWSAVFSSKGGFGLDILKKKYNTQVAMSDAEREQLAKQTKVYTEYTLLKKFLDDNYSNLINSDFVEEIHNKFKEIAQYFLKINFKRYGSDYTSWCTDLLDKIKDNMDIFHDRCIRATHLVDPEEVTIIEKIEEHFNYKF